MAYPRDDPAVVKKFQNILKLADKQGGLEELRSTARACFIVEAEAEKAGKLETNLKRLLELTPEKLTTKTRNYLLAPRSIRARIARISKQFQDLQEVDNFFDVTSHRVEKIARYIHMNKPATIVQVHIFNVRLASIDAVLVAHGITVPSDGDSAESAASYRLTFHYNLDKQEFTMMAGLKVVSPLSKVLNTCNTLVVPEQTRVLTGEQLEALLEMRQTEYNRLSSAMAYSATTKEAYTRAIRHYVIFKEMLASGISLVYSEITAERERVRAAFVARLNALVDRIPAAAARLGLTPADPMDVEKQQQQQQQQQPVEEERAPEPAAKKARKAPYTFFISGSEKGAVQPDGGMVETLLAQPYEAKALLVNPSETGSAATAEPSQLVAPASTSGAVLVNVSVPRNMIDREGTEARGIKTYSSADSSPYVQVRAQPLNVHKKRTVTAMEAATESHTVHMAVPVTFVLPAGVEHYRIESMSLMLNLQPVDAEVGLTKTLATAAAAMAGEQQQNKEVVMMM